MISISNVEFCYSEGEFSLDVPHLEIVQGVAAAVVGPSGCGKTTLLNLIAGVSLPSSGRIFTNSVDVTGLSDAERRDFRIRNIGLVFQEFELLEYLSVFDNILLPYRVSRSLVLTEAVRGRAIDLAGGMGIGDKLNRHPNKLSQGERQRVAVCRALLHQPALLLADEPTGNLDPGNKTIVLDILLEHAKDTGATLVTVTHDHDLIGRFDRVIDFRDFHASHRSNGTEAPG